MKITNHSIKISQWQSKKRTLKNGGIKSELWEEQELSSSIDVITVDPPLHLNRMYLDCSKKKIG